MLFTESGSYASPFIEQHFVGTDYCNSIHVDSTGVYLSGASSNGAAMIASRYDLAGGLDWQDSFSLGGAPVGGNPMVIVGEYMYIVGAGLNLADVGSGSDAVLRKINKITGAEDVAFRQIIDYSNANEEFRTLVWHEQSSSLLVVGARDGPTSKDGWIKRFFTDGSEDDTFEVIWNGVNDDIDEFYAIAIDPSGDLFVGGYSTDYISHPADGSLRDMLLLRFSGP